MIIRLLKQI